MSACNLPRDVWGLVLEFVAGVDGSVDYDAADINKIQTLCDVAAVAATCRALCGAVAHARQADRKTALRVMSDSRKLLCTLARRETARCQWVCSVRRAQTLCALRPWHAWLLGLMRTRSRRAVQLHASRPPHPGDTAVRTSRAQKHVSALHMLAAQRCIVCFRAMPAFVLRPQRKSEWCDIASHVTVCGGECMPTIVSQVYREGAFPNAMVVAEIWPKAQVKHELPPVLLCSASMRFIMSPCRSQIVFYNALTLAVVDMLCIGASGPPLSPALHALRFRTAFTLADADMEVVRSLVGPLVPAVLAK